MWFINDEPLQVFLDQNNKSYKNLNKQRHWEESERVLLDGNRWNPVLSERRGRLIFTKQSEPRLSRSTCCYHGDHRCGQMWSVKTSGRESDIDSEC